MKERRERETLSLLLLMWLRTVNPFYARLSKNIAREISTYYAQDLLPCLSHGRLVIYNVRSGSEVAVRTSFFEASLFCLADRETAICFRASESQSVLVLNLLTCLLSPLPDMGEARRCQEVIHFEGVTYVFGGLAEYKYIRTCEQFDRREGKWTYLPATSAPRHSAWPCEYEREIYLPPLYSFENIEVFTVASRSFRFLSPSIPHGSSWVTSVSFILRGELVVLTTDGEQARWHVKGGEKEFRVRKLGVKAEKVHCAPVRCGKEVVWFASGQLLRLNCDTFALQQMPV